jgi:glutamine synthetase
LAKDAGVKIVDLDLRFADLPGVWPHFSIPVEDLGDDLFGEGIRPVPHEFFLYFDL